MRQLLLANECPDLPGKHPEVRIRDFGQLCRRGFPQSQGIEGTGCKGGRDQISQEAGSQERILTLTFYW